MKNIQREVIASAKDDQVSIVAMRTKDLTKQFDDCEILKNGAARAGGRGGGKLEMAQRWTKELNKLDSALESVYSLVKKEVAGSQKFRLL
jgi:alanyl-tRNA synthetase